MQAVWNWEVPRVSSPPAHLEEVPQRDSFQQGTRVWKLVCSSLLREDLLRSRWIELRVTLPLTKLASRIERNPLEAKHTGSQHVRGSSPKDFVRNSVHALEAGVR